MKHKLTFFSPAGDTSIAEWEETDAKQVEVARGAFDQAKREGWGAVVATPEGTKSVDTFSPDLEEIFLLRPIAGG